MEYKREIDLFEILKKKSFFLLGPRSTGKTFWIKKTLPSTEVLFMSLLQGNIFIRLSENPSLLQEMTQGFKNIVIDEIQKLPILLDEIHLLIEDEGKHFLLTGSSARKLKRENANLLGGRASSVHFFPLVYPEIVDFNLKRRLHYGGLPRIYNSLDPEAELDDYITNYLEQEVKIEANVRSLLPFARFIKSAALNHGELINFTNISNDSGVPVSTVKEYYKVLEDTLVGFCLEPWLESKKRKAIATAKFYFFDNGVAHRIVGIENLDRHSNLWGKAFEQFLISELLAYDSYHQKRKKFHFWRSVNKQEVDMIINNQIAIEIKSATKITEKHLLGLKALKEEKIIKEFYLLSEDKLERQTDGIHIQHWKSFLKKLWNGEIF